MTPQNPNRREFLQATTAGLAVTGLLGAVDAGRLNDGGIPLRRLGKTGEVVSVLCLGGHACTNPWKLSEKASLRLIQRAVDEGIHFMDNCWDYHHGGAEEWMGKALSEGGRRERVFLMTKVCGRTAKEAQANLEDSLRRLRTDRIDLWQFHELVYDNFFYSGRSLTPLCRAIQVLAWDCRAASLRRMWYSTSNSANSRDNPGTSIAL